MKDVWRAPGNAAQVRKLSHIMQHGRLVNISNISVYTAASVIKKFLSKLPGGIFGVENERTLFTIAQQRDPDEQRQTFCRVICSLSTPSQHLLVLLFGTFRVITDSSDAFGTRMTPDAIGISVAPSLMHTCIHDGNRAKLEDVMRFKTASQVISVIIQSFGFTNLFPRECYEFYARISGRMLRVDEQWHFTFQYPANSFTATGGGSDGEQQYPSLSRRNLPRRKSSATSNGNGGGGVASTSTTAAETGSGSSGGGGVMTRNQRRRAVASLGQVGAGSQEQQVQRAASLKNPRGSPAPTAAIAHSKTLSHGNVKPTSMATSTNRMSFPSTAHHHRHLHGSGEPLKLAPKDMNSAEKFFSITEIEVASPKLSSLDYHPHSHYHPHPHSHYHPTEPMELAPTTNNKEEGENSASAREFPQVAESPRMRAHIVHYSSPHNMAYRLAATTAIGSSAPLPYSTSSSSTTNRPLASVENRGGPTNGAHQPAATRMTTRFSSTDLGSPQQSSSGGGAVQQPRPTTSQRSHGLTTTTPDPQQFPTATLQRRIKAYCQAANIAHSVVHTAKGGGNDGRAADFHDAHDAHPSQQHKPTKF